MKTINFICLMLYIFAIGCQKEKDFDRSYGQAATPLKIAVASKTIYVPWPKDSVWVSAANTQTNGSWAGLSIKWSTIQGQGSPVLHHPNADACLITGLQRGAYGFELKVSANDGRMAKDTQYVVVGGLSPQAKELIIGFESWASGPFWNRIELNDFPAYLLANGINASTYFELYIKTKLTNGQWERVGSDQFYTPDTRYSYLLQDDGTMFVFDLTSEGKLGEGVELMLRYD